MKIKNWRSIECKRGSVVLAEWYRISLDRISEHRDLVCWMVHLAEKRWVTTSMLREFAIVVCDEKGWDAPFR